MSFMDKLQASGIVNIKKYNESGILIFEQTTKNKVVDTGLSYIASRMKDGGPTQMTHMGIGNSSQTPAAGDTNLIGAISPRVALSTAGGTVSGAIVTYTASFGAGVATGAITEAGIFSALTSGTMLCRTTFPVINKNSGDSLVITWQITMAAAA